MSGTSASEAAELGTVNPDGNCWQGWNQVLVELWTHARDGLTENDFILAAKLNKLPKEDLLRKPKKKLTDSY